MKKFISFAAYALLASALTFSLAACSSDDDDALSGLPEVPENAEQAKAMLMGQWQMKAPRTKWYDEEFFDFNADGHVYKIEKISKSISEKEWQYPDRGLRIGYIYDEEFEIRPDDDDPTQGMIVTDEYWDEETESWVEDENVTTIGYQYTKLTKSSVTIDGQEFVRPAKKVSFFLRENTPE